MCVLLRNETMKRIKQLLPIAFVWLILTGCTAQKTAKASGNDFVTVPVAEFGTRLASDSSALLLDVRRPEEYAEGHLRGAVPLNWLDTDAFKEKSVAIDRKRTIYVYCRSGRRSREAAIYLSAKGYKVVDMEGGILAWGKAGCPILK